MNFDRKDGAKKIAGVSRFVLSGSWKPLLAEIAKCDIVCANYLGIASQNATYPIS
jgi:hypothetical protein